MSYTAEPPLDPPPPSANAYWMTAPQHPAYAWWRVLASDGSTVAYVPDALTASRIAAFLEASRP